jgi:hypothetical protein
VCTLCGTTEVDALTTRLPHISSTACISHALSNPVHDKYERLLCSFQPLVSPSDVMLTNAAIPYLQEMLCLAAIL